MALTGGADHGAPTVSRWRKYGQDRMYVNGSDGSRLGWLDVKTGIEHLEAPERAAEFRQALAECGGGPELSEGVSDPRLTVGQDPKDTVDESLDLALNRPGQAAREQAEQHLATQKSRSRVLSAVARALDVKTDERAWRKGAEGEESVGARLEKLRVHGWQVLHSVPVGERGSDIDHVLIGPGGVFTVNTKNHPGKRIWVSPTQVRVDGHVQPYLRNSRFEAKRAATILSAAVGWEVQVRPALVLLTGTLIPDVTIKSGGPEDVLILDRIDIPRVFKKAPTRLSGEQVDQVFQMARRSSIWR